MQRPTLAVLFFALRGILAFRVIVTGGTHGNEYTGVWVVRRLDQRAAELKSTYPSLSIETLLANPRAHEQNVRLIDADLNRMFSEADLSSSVAPVGYEARRAREIHAAVGSASVAPADLLIDLHTTTTNMGCTLIVGAYSRASLAAAAYIQEQWRRADSDQTIANAFPLRVLIDENYNQAECPYLCSIARDGLEIEVGPVAQGLLRADAVAATQHALELAL